MEEEENINNIIKKYTYKHNVLFNQNVKLKKIIYQLSKVDLDPNDKELVMARVINLYSNFDIKYNRYSKFYTMSVIIVLISSILVTTLLSLNDKPSCDSTANEIYWTTFTLSLIVSIINSFSAFFKWDRKYILLFQIINQLEHEIWTYIELIASYKVSNHNDNMKLFLTKIELLSKNLNKNLVDLEEKDKDNDKSIKRFQRKSPISPMAITSMQLRIDDEEDNFKENEIIDVDL